MKTKCGSRCTPTCDNPKPKCIKKCVERCECPPSQPILHKGICTIPKYCPSANRTKKTEFNISMNYIIIIVLLLIIFILIIIIVYLYRLSSNREQASSERQM